MEQQNFEFIQRTPSNAFADLSPSNAAENGSNGFQGGNPTVTYLVEDFDKLDVEICCSTAKVDQVTEISVVRKNSDGSFDIRFFAPNEEVNMCIHALLGAAKFVSEKYNLTDQIIFNTKNGRTEILKDGDNYFVKFGNGEVGNSVKVEDVVETINLNAEAIAPNSPNQNFSVGSQKTIMFLNSENDLENIDLEFEKLKNFQANNNSKGLYLVAGEIKEGNTLRSRQWNVALAREVDGKINFEDPKTGIALGALGFYILNNLGIRDIELKMDQGPKDRAKGLLILKIKDGEIFVGGKVN